MVGHGHISGPCIGTTCHNWLKGNVTSYQHANQRLHHHPVHVATTSSLLIMYKCIYVQSNRWYTYLLTQRGELCAYTVLISSQANKTLPANLHRQTLCSQPLPLPLLPALYISWVTPLCPPKVLYCQFHNIHSPMSA